MSKHKVKLNYTGSIFWLIFWLIIWFPAGLILFVTASSFTWNQSHYSIAYEGSRAWLVFWAIVFFPIALLLVVLKGLSVEINPQLA